MLFEVVKNKIIGEVTTSKFRVNGINVYGISFYNDIESYNKGVCFNNYTVLETTIRNNIKYGIWKVIK